MASTRLILRSVVNNFPTPFEDTVKGSVLSHIELDNNQIYLKSEIIHTGRTTGTILILDKIGGKTIDIDLNALISSTDNFTTGGTLIGDVVYFDRSDALSAYTVNLSALTEDIESPYVFNSGTTTAIEPRLGSNPSISPYANIGGGINNNIGLLSRYSSILGGGFNVITGLTTNLGQGGSYSSIGGGYGNDIQDSAYSNIGGGKDNQLTYIPVSVESGDVFGIGNVIGGGWENIQIGPAKFNTIAGGQANVINFGTVGGSGFTVTYMTDFATIGGGWQNRILSGSSYSSIGGGYSNLIENANNSTIVSGEDNILKGGSSSLDVTNSIIGGGKDNIISGTTTIDNSVIGGGNLNVIKGSNVNSSFIGSGTKNIIDSTHSFIGGGEYNQIYSSRNSIIVGGGADSDGYQNKIINAGYSFVGGGYSNVISGSSVSDKYCFIGGGKQNKIYNSFNASILGGGDYNLHNVINSSDWSIIGGGKNNVLTNATNSSVVAGSGNSVTHVNTHVIGSDITSISADTTMVERLNVGSVLASTPITILATDVNGMIVSGNTIAGGAFTHTATGNIIPTNAYGSSSISPYSTIVGGKNHSITTSAGTGSGNVVLGGSGNNINTDNGGNPFMNTIGGYNNIITSTGHATIVSGYKNQINSVDRGFNRSDFTFMGGGVYNVISASSYTSIVGGGKYVAGSGNTISYSNYSFIGGGYLNTITSAKTATIIGGSGNTVNHVNAHILGSNITSISADTTMVESLNIGTSVAVTATASGGTIVDTIGVDATGTVIKGFRTITKDIGDWNMDSSGTVSVNHGLSATEFKTIRITGVIIRSDADDTYHNLMTMDDITGGLMSGAIDFFDDTTIDLMRRTGGKFDTTAYDSTGFNRGWIYIDYIKD